MKQAAAIVLTIILAWLLAAILVTASAQEPPSAYMAVPPECTKGGCRVLTAAQVREVQEVLVALLAEVERLERLHKQSCRRLPHDV